MLRIYAIPQSNYLVNLDQVAAVHAPVQDYTKIWFAIHIDSVWIKIESTTVLAQGASISQRSAAMKRFTAEVYNPFLEAWKN